MKKLIGLLTVLTSLILPVTAADIKPEDQAPDFTLTASTGEKITLADLRGKPVILEWTNHKCPYVRKHYKSGNMQKLQKKLTEDGAVWLSVISSAPGKQGHVSAEKSRELTAKRGVYASYVLHDEDGKIGRLYKSSTTPQMVLIDEKGIIKYMGAIDDQPSVSMKSLKGAENYLLRAWSEFKSGQEISKPQTQPYGCSIKYAG